MESFLTACSYVMASKIEGVKCKMKASYHSAGAIEPLFDTQDFDDFISNVPTLKRISAGSISWAGDGNPNDSNLSGKNDILSEQFHASGDVNYYRKTNSDMIMFLQSEGWLCLVRIRKVLRMLNALDKYEETMESLSRAAGHQVDLWGSVFEKKHNNQCKCPPCIALKEVKKQLQKKNVTAQEIIPSVIHYVRRCVYRVFVSGIDRVFETFCNGEYMIVWFLLPEEFENHYRDSEFEKLASLIMNDVVAVEPIISYTNFGKMFYELYEGASELARAVLHKFGVILNSQKTYYTTALNFVMFFIESFNMIIKILRWMETKFKVFNHLANRTSTAIPDNEDKLDLKCLILHVVANLVYRVPEVENQREVAMKIIAEYQKTNNSYYGPDLDNIKLYLKYIDRTLDVATDVFKKSNLPFECPKFKVPKTDVIEAALYINPYRVDQFDTPQVFHCYYHNRFVVERSLTPWKILYNNKANILLRLTAETPTDTNKRLAINVFVAEESTSSEDRTKDQYYALYESKLNRVVEFFDVVKTDIVDGYPEHHTTHVGITMPKLKKSTLRKYSKPNRPYLSSYKISVPVKLKRPDIRSKTLKARRLAVFATLVQKHKKTKKPTTMENLEELLTFAVKAGVQGSGMLPDLAKDDAKDVYVSITSVDKVRRAKADQEFSLQELMSFIIFWYVRHGCVTEFEGHTLHRTTFACSKSAYKESSHPLYKAPEEVESVTVDGVLSDSDLAALEKTLSGAMTDDEIKRCRKGIETTLLMKREIKEGGSTSRISKLPPSGFCVTLSGTAEAATILSSEAEMRKGCSRKNPSAARISEIRNKMRKSLEERHSEATIVRNANPGVQDHDCRCAEEDYHDDLFSPLMTESAHGAMGMDDQTNLDVDELVQLIEGTQLKSDPNPKKAAKKARQKEKKEQERQRVAEEKEKEEKARLVVERKREAEAAMLRELSENWKRHQEEINRQLKEQKRKQEVAEQRKEEQRRKREELERKKEEEKRLKKDAKKQRREQRKRDLEQNSKAKLESNSTEVPVKVETKNNNKGSPKSTGTLSPEKEYGRLKHEKEQRKREEEEARRLEELQAQERVQATKKNKKKKKKQKHGSGGNSNDQSLIQSMDKLEVSSPPVGKPLMEILNANKGDGAQGKPADEKSNLVTIRKHMDSTVTISMRGKEGEKDTVYTLMNGQVYPTGADGKICPDEALPLQQTAFTKVEPPKQSFTPVNPIGYMSPSKAPGYSVSKPAVPVSHFPKPATAPIAMPEIDLTQLKLPPGITITKVPQNLNAPRPEMNGLQNHNTPPDFYGKPAPQYANDYQRPAPIVDHRLNSNVTLIESRCSSIESPVTGTADMGYVAGGTRPSSEASIASDRPSSGMDSLSNNGSHPYAGRSGFQSTEMLNKHVPISMTSPYTTTSRNETPSPAWQNEMGHNLPGMLSQNHALIQEKSGFWSSTSTPASPVPFPQQTVPEGYMRAQDNLFIKPRPQQRPPYVGTGKPSPPINPQTYNHSKSFMRRSHDYKSAGNLACHKPPVPQAAAINRLTTNGSSSHLGPVGEKPVYNNNQHKFADQWTLWNQNGERNSPDIPQGTSTFYGANSISLKDILDQDNSSPWESAGIEKPSVNRQNPFGAIGSNIARRSSTTMVNGSFEKMADDSHPGDQPVWAYNPTF